MRSMRGLCGVAIVLATTTAVMAARPLVIGDAAPVDTGKFQIEAGMSYAEDAGPWAVDVPLTLSYGLMKDVEVGVGWGYQWVREAGDRTENGVDDIALGGKWMYATQERLFLDQAIAAGVRFPTADDDRGLGSGETDWDLMWIGTRHLSEAWEANVNVGYTWTGNTRNEDLSDVLHYGVSTTYDLTKHFTPVLEVFVDTPVNGDDSWHTSVFLNGGMQWHVAESLTLDAAVGTTLSGEGPNVFATAGLTWVF